MAPGVKQEVIYYVLASRKPKETRIKAWVAELIGIHVSRRGNIVLAEGWHPSLFCSNYLKESLIIWITGFQPDVSSSSLVFCFGTVVLFWRIPWCCLFTASWSNSKSDFGDFKTNFFVEHMGSSTPSTIKEACAPDAGENSKSKTILGLTNSFQPCWWASSVLGH